MYAPFFGLKQAPFSIAPDPHYLFMSERHREALAHLLYGLDSGGGFVLLTGEIGAGKTTICRCFLEQIPANCNVAYIFNPKLTVTELLQAICDEFHVSVAPGTQTVKGYVDLLNAFLLAQHASGRNNVLIIDEAQNLSAEVLEQLRLLTNLETPTRKLLQVVLIGQPELRGLLAQPELEQLAQRVIARFHLGALSETETAQYVHHRLNVAGLTGALPFNSAALRRVHQLTRGVPRRINLLCDRALLGGYASGQAQITPAIVRQAAVEVFGLPITPAPAPARAPGPATTRRGPAGVGMGAAVLAAAVAGAGLTWGLKLQSPAERGSPASGVAAAAAVATRAAPGAAAVSAARAPSPASAATALLPGNAAANCAANSAANSAANAAANSASPARSPEPLRLADWAPQDGDAWAALAQRWGLALPAQADPCTVASLQGLQCYRTTSGSLSLVRLIDRPVLLTLRRPGQPPALAALVGLEGQQATLWVAGQPRRVPLSELAGAWQGEFITLWRTPPGYATRADNSQLLRDGLAAQLAHILDMAGPGLGAPAGQAASDPAGVAANPAAAPSWAALASPVQAFQASQGLQPDGRVGPITLMQINRAAGVAEPHLER